MSDALKILKRLRRRMRRERNRWSKIADDDRGSRRRESSAFSSGRTGGLYTAAEWVDQEIRKLEESSTNG